MKLFYRKPQSTSSLLLIKRTFSTQVPPKPNTQQVNPETVQQEQPSPKRKIVHTFHVAMLLFGSGSSYQHLEDNKEQGATHMFKRHELLGTNLLEVTALRIALSQHKVQIKYFSINGSPYGHINKRKLIKKEGEEAQSQEEQEVDPDVGKPVGRNLMVESARITRNARDLVDIKKISIESYQALIIPSFVDPYDKRVVEDIYNNASIRTAIKEFNLKRKLIVPIGPSAINLVGKSLGIQLRTSPIPSQKDPFKLSYHSDLHLLSLPYDQRKLSSDVNSLALFHLAIESTVQSMKERVQSVLP